MSSWSFAPDSPISIANFVSRVMMCNRPDTNRVFLLTDLSMLETVQSFNAVVSHFTQNVKYRVDSLMTLDFGALDAEFPFLCSKNIEEVTCDLDSGDKCHLLFCSMTTLPFFPALVYDTQTDFFSNSDTHAEPSARVFVGGANTADCAAVFKHLRITHVVNASNNNSAPFQDTVKYLNIDAHDNDNQPMVKAWAMCARFLHEALREGGRVLVHCNQGKSRSVSCVAAYLIHLHPDLHPAEAVDHIKKGREIAAPNCGFMRQLDEWYSLWHLMARSQGYKHCSGNNNNKDQQDKLNLNVSQGREVYQGWQTGSSLRPYETQTTTDWAELLTDSEYAMIGGTLLEPSPPAHPPPAPPPPARDQDCRANPAREGVRQAGAGGLLGCRDAGVVSILSEGECCRLISAAELIGFGRTSYPQHYRGNLRLMAKDIRMAQLLWERLQPHVPETVQCEEGHDWKAVGLNEMWRLSKYFAGTRFQRHCDTNFERSQNQRSMYTVNIYLNDKFQGGKTRFYTLSDTIDAEIVPRTGAALFFRQPPVEAYCHDGEEVHAGVKYLLRSDVMFERLPVEAQPPS